MAEYRAAPGPLNPWRAPTWRETQLRRLHSWPRWELEALRDRPHSALAWVAARVLDERDEAVWGIVVDFSHLSAKPGEGTR